MRSARKCSIFVQLPQRWEFDFTSSAENAAISICNLLARILPLSLLLEVPYEQGSMLNAFRRFSAEFVRFRVREYWNGRASRR
jgi:hypothetical protein